LGSRWSNLDATCRVARRGLSWIENYRKVYIMMIAKRKTGIPAAIILGVEVLSRVISESTLLQDVASALREGAKGLAKGLAKESSGE
jgi:hypothetical protein